MIILFFLLRPILRAVRPVEVANKPCCKSSVAASIKKYFDFALTFLQ